MTPLIKTLNRLTKWRSVFAGWQLGTRTDTDPECRAVRDHREITILMRAELSALVNLLAAKGVFTAAEYEAALMVEADALDKAYQAQFPGFRSSDSGMVINPALAKDTMAGWRP
jgi:hypothetical protein